MSLERYLAELCDESKPIKYTGLVRLSDLTPAEMEVVKAHWRKVPTSRRRLVLSRLVEMAEDNIEVDFMPFFQFCLHDPDEEVRAKAVEGLWECEERHLITTFLAILREDSSPKVRAAAAQALGKFASLVQEGKFSPKEGERIRSALLEAFHQPGQPLEVRRRALEALAPFNDEEVEALIHQAYQAAEPLLRQSAVYAMGRTCDSKWLPFILQELASPDPGMRYEAASACGELGEESALPHLLNLYKEEGDTQVRLAIISALGNIGGAVARKFLQGLLRSSEESIREAAQEALRVLEFSEDPLSFKYPT